MKNDELEDLIKKFNQVQPSELQLQKWLRSSRDSSVKRGSLKFAAGLAAGIAIGFFCAKLIFSTPAPSTSHEEYASNVNYYYQNN